MVAGHTSQCVVKCQLEMSALKKSSTAANVPSLLKTTKRFDTDENDEDEEDV
jgi:hypothetical protein